jgi:predicted nucleic acid-binding protein
LPIFLPDSNCLVAVVSPWHEHHEAATAELGRRLDRGDTMALAAPALVEAYAVLTRLPAPHRLSPADAYRLLDVNFVRRATVVTLDEVAYLDVLARGPSTVLPADGRTTRSSLRVRHGPAQTRWSRSTSTISGD